MYDIYFNDFFQSLELTFEMKNKARLYEKERKIYQYCT